MVKEFEQLESEYGKYGTTAIFSTLVLLVLIVSLIAIAYFIDDNKLDRVYNYFFILLGSICGWALGILSSPYNRDEESKFSSISKAISAFISGYALSKFDRFIEAALFIDSATPKFEFWIRVGFFISATGLFALLVFSNRAYFRTEEEPTKIFIS